MKKVREGRLRMRPATDRCRVFAADVEDTFFVVEMTRDLITDAAAIMLRHGGLSRLHSGDAVQLACAKHIATELRPPVYTLVVCDKGIRAIARGMGYQVWNPDKDELGALFGQHAGLWP